MYPVTITIHNDEQLKAVHGVLNGVPAAAPAAAAAAPAPAKPVKPKATPAPASPPASTAPAGPVLSAAGLAFVNTHLAGPVKELSMKNEPKMAAICAEYGVERVSLIPEAMFPEVLAKVQAALDPGAAERARLEAIDKAKEGAAVRSLL